MDGRTTAQRNVIRKCFADIAAEAYWGMMEQKRIMCFVRRPDCDTAVQMLDSHELLLSFNTITEEDPK